MDKNQTYTYKLNDFSYVQNLPKKLEDLAQMAKYEKWDFDNKDDSGKLSILKNYVLHNFERIFEQNLYKIIKSSKVKIACYNTSLKTITGESICAFFEENHNKDRQPFYLKGFSRSSDIELNGFTDLQEATYFSYEGEQNFHIEHKLEIRYIHILVDNFERLPPEWKALGKFSHRREMFDKAVNFTLQLIKTGNLVVEYSYYKGKIQYLLPLFVRPENVKADLVLVAQPSGESQYHLPTVLTPAMAYNDARLLGPITTDWLFPYEKRWA